MPAVSFSAPVQTAQVFQGLFGGVRVVPGDHVDWRLLDVRDHRRVLGYSDAFSAVMMLCRCSRAACRAVSGWCWLIAPSGARWVL
jgi:hypothetical protein